MTKPRDSRTVSSQKAPRASRPSAPFAQVGEKSSTPQSRKSAPAGQALKPAPRSPYASRPASPGVDAGTNARSTFPRNPTRIQDRAEGRMLDPAVPREREAARRREPKPDK